MIHLNCWPRNLLFICVGCWYVLHLLCKHLQWTTTKHVLSRITAAVSAASSTLADFKAAQERQESRVYIGSLCGCTAWFKKNIQQIKQLSIAIALSCWFHLSSSVLLRWSCWLMLNLWDALDARILGARPDVSQLMARHRSATGISQVLPGSFAQRLHEEPARPTTAKEESSKLTKYKRN